MAHHHLHDFCVSYRQGISPNPASLQGYPARSRSCGCLCIYNLCRYCLLQQVGASQGPSGLRPYAPQWAPVFESLPSPLLVPFLRALLREPSGGAATAAIFAPQLLQTLARLMLDPEGGSGVGDAALLLLAELCELVKPQVIASYSPSFAPLPHDATIVCIGWLLGTLIG